MLINERLCLVVEAGGKREAIYYYDDNCIEYEDCFMNHSSDLETNKVYRMIQIIHQDKYKVVLMDETESAMTKQFKRELLRLHREEMRRLREM